VRHIDLPASASWRRGARDDVAAGREQSVGDAVCFEHEESLLQDVTLRDAAEIQLHACPKQPHGSRQGVELDVPPTDTRAGE